VGCLYPVLSKFGISGSALTVGAITERNKNRVDVDTSRIKTIFNIFLILSTSLNFQNLS